MAIGKLAHYAVRAPNLEASLRFYTGVLGLRPGFRPPFAFPGTWLYRDDDESDFGVVHLIGDGPEADAYLGPGREEAARTGPLDHVAFLATGWADLRARWRGLDVRYTERTVPGLGLHQVFLADPAGVVIELNFPAHEAAAS